jgi:ABC-type transport system substrate-binding protein
MLRTSSRPAESQTRATGKKYAHHSGRSARSLPGCLTLFLVLLIVLSGLSPVLLAEDVPETTPAESQAAETDTPQVSELATEATATESLANGESATPEESQEASDPEQSLPEAEPTMPEESLPEESLPEGSETQPETDLPEEVFPSQVELENPFKAEPDRLTILLPLEETDKADNTLHLSLLHYNPLLLNSLADLSLSELLYRPLYLSNDSGNYGLAESYELSDDHKSISFLLKQDLTWEDGLPLTSRDLHYTLACLLQADLAYPWQNFLPYLKGYDALKTRQNDREQYPDPPAFEPFLQIAGIEAPNDEQLILHFTREIDPFLQELCRLPAIPVHIWWNYEPKDWSQLTYIHAPNEDFIENEEKPAYLAASSGPYSFDHNLEDALLSLGNSYWSQHPDLLLDERAEDFEDTNTENSYAKISQIQVRYTDANDPATELLGLQADLALLPTLQAEDQTLLEADGYHLLELPTPQVLSLRYNAELEDNIFLNSKLKEALYFLCPTAEELQAASGIPLFSLEEDSDRASNSERASAYKTKQGLNLEERQKKALDLLLEAGYFTAASTEEQLTKAQAAGQAPVALPQITICYHSGSELSDKFINAFYQNCQAVGLYPALIQLESSELDPETDLDATELYLEISSGLHKQEKNSLPLYQEGCYLASKRVENLSAQNYFYFSGSEDWVLEP